MQTLELIQQKIYTLPQLLKKLHLWRFKEQKIVFANGCFDLLHWGHLQMLTQTADLGDKLIIGLNSDQSVKGLKGTTRPIQDEQTRASILAAFSFVDALIIFDTSTPYDLISEILPDVLVKGGDYQKKEIEGGSLVEQNGGEVVLIPYTKEFSTTKIIHTIQQKT